MATLERSAQFQEKRDPARAEQPVLYGLQFDVVPTLLLSCRFKTYILDVPLRFSGFSFSSSILVVCAPATAPIST